MDYLVLGWIEKKLGNGSSLEFVLMLESVNYIDWFYVGSQCLSGRAQVLVYSSGKLWVCNMWIIVFIHVNNKPVSHNVRSESFMASIWNPYPYSHRMILLNYFSLHIYWEFYLNWILAEECFQNIVFKYTSLIFRLQLALVWLRLCLDLRPKVMFGVPKWFHRNLLEATICSFWMDVCRRYFH